MVPFKIISRDFPVTQSIRFEIEKHVGKLEKVFDRITSCDVVLSLPHKHNQKGKIFHLSLKLHVPGEVLVVDREPEMNAAHEDFHLAVRDAFGALKRRLTDYADLKKARL